MPYKAEINKLQPRLFSFIKSKIFNFHDAQDILQNVNLILLNKEGDYDKNKSLQGWAFKIAKFQIKGYLSSSKRRGQKEKDQKDLTFSSFFVNKWGGKTAIIDSFDCPNSIIEEKERDEILNKKLLFRKKLLSQNQLKIIDMYSEGMSQKEISKALNMKLSTVSVTKSRAIERMKV